MPGYANVNQSLTGMGIGPGQVAWWQIALLDLERGSEESQLRSAMQTGNPPQPWTYDHALLWGKVVAMARKQWGTALPADAVREDPVRALHKALWCYRTFCQLIDLRDDDMEPWVLGDFHVRGIRAMRQSPVGVIMWPFMHGKSANSSVLVPLLDWAENKEATQLRVYRAKEFSTLWVRKLMALIETSEALHALCPWIRRPEKGDPCEGIWSTVGFSIGGKQVVDPSFRPLTIGGSMTGLRGDRVGLDDLVDERNAFSFAVQDRYHNIIKTGALTGRRYRPDWKRSSYGTLWGTLYLIGTPFDRGDVNYRLSAELHERMVRGDRTYKVIRESVYPRGDRSRADGEVLWPEKRPLDYVQQAEDELGKRGFRLRMMCQPLESKSITFTEDLINGAIEQGQVYGYGLRPPEGARVVVAFDPGTGKRTRYTKFPACVVVGYNPQIDRWYLIRYERWELPMPKQVALLTRIAADLNCPVVVESNATQHSYQEWLELLGKGNVRVEESFTDNTKHSSDDGVESWQPLFESGKVVICSAGAETAVLNDFKNEWLGWPGNRYNDMVMAAWIGKQHLFNKFGRAHAHQSERRVPAYVDGRGFRQVIDLTEYLGDDEEMVGHNGADWNPGLVDRPGAASRGYRSYTHG